MHALQVANARLCSSCQQTYALRPIDIGDEDDPDDARHRFALGSPLFFFCTFSYCQQLCACDLSVPVNQLHYQNWCPPTNIRADTSGIYYWCDPPEVAQTRSQGPERSVARVFRSSARSSVWPQLLKQTDVCRSYIGSFPCNATSQPSVSLILWGATTIINGETVIRPKQIKNRAS